MKGQLSQYKWQIALFLVVGILIGYVVATGVVTVGLAKGGTPATGKECNDKIDNDNDGDIDLADAGCSSRNDNDESNCGDGICEGQETCDVCVSDCGYCTTCGDGICAGSETCSNCVADCRPCDSCSDTDGGYVITSQGTVSGYSEGSLYSYTDACNSTILIEHYCVGKQPNTVPFDCAMNFTACSSGACI